MTERTFHPLCEQLADVLSASLRADRSGEEIVQDILDAINAEGYRIVRAPKTHREYEDLCALLANELMP